MRGTSRWSREECEESYPEKEGAAGTKCDGLTVTPIPHPPAPLGSEAEPGKKGGVGGRCFKIYFLYLIILL